MATRIAGETIGQCGSRDGCLLVSAVAGSPRHARESHWCATLERETASGYRPTLTLALTSPFSFT